MKAMILASGIGSRLAPITDSIPKCLVPIVKNKSILEIQLDAFQKYTIKDVIITTGPFKDKVQRLVTEKYPTMNISYVYNEKYDSTNYIYSMYKCRDLIDDDFILVHGDLVYDDSLLKGLIEQVQSCVCMNKNISPPEKDFKGRVVDGMVQEIGVNVFNEDTFFLAPLYMLKKHDFILWMDNIAEFIKQKKYNVYAEDAFNVISNKFRLIPFFFNKQVCCEIDELNDLTSVRNILNR